MQHSEVRLGQRVVVTHGHWPGVWIVVKINPKNIKLEQQVDGRNRRLNCFPGYMTLADGTSAEVASLLATAPDAPIMPDNEPPPEPFVIGTVVQVKPDYLPMFRGQYAPTADTLLVVTTDRYDKVNVTVLGGTKGGRYYSNIPTRMLTKVDVTSMVQSYHAQQRMMNQPV